MGRLGGENLGRQAGTHLQSSARGTTPLGNESGLRYPWASLGAASMRHRLLWSALVSTCGASREDDIGEGLFVGPVAQQRDLTCLSDGSDI